MCAATDTETKPGQRIFQWKLAPAVGQSRWIAAGQPIRHIAGHWPYCPQRTRYGRTARDMLAPVGSRIACSTVAAVGVNRRAQRSPAHARPPSCAEKGHVLPAVPLQARIVCPAFLVCVCGFVSFGASTIPALFSTAIEAGPFTYSALGPSVRPAMSRGPSDVEGLDKAMNAGDFDQPPRADRNCLQGAVRDQLVRLGFSNTEYLRALRHAAQ